MENKQAPIVCFLICDPESVYVLNAVGKLWAAEKIENNFKCFGSNLTVGNNIAMSFDGLHDKCKDLGLWDGNVSQTYRYLTIY